MLSNEHFKLRIDKKRVLAFILGYCLHQEKIYSKSGGDPNTFKIPNSSELETIKNQLSNVVIGTGEQNNTNGKVKNPYSINIGNDIKLDGSQITDIYKNPPKLNIDLVDDRRNSKSSKKSRHSKGTKKSSKRGSKNRLDIGAEVTVFMGGALGLTTATDEKLSNREIMKRGLMESFTS